jgi:hypothetical protein
MKKRYAVCHEANVNMTTFHGDTIKIPMAELTRMFGDPCCAVSEKIQFEWAFFGPNGSIVTLFDWNSTANAPDKWHVGGLKAEHTRDFVKWFDKIRKLI